MKQQLHGRFTCGVSARAGHAVIASGLLPQLRVSVDGDVLRTVVAADTWRGWADVVRRDGAGAPVTLAGVVQLDRRHGRVEAALVDASFDDVDLLVREGLALG